jgi:hypothetical protein
MVNRLPALPSNFNMVLPSAGIGESSGIVLPFQSRMELVAIWLMMAGTVYVTFTAVKERVVQAGQLRAAAAVAS